MRFERIPEPPAPLDGRHQRSNLSKRFSKRRRWESNPLQTALQAAAFPSGSDVGCPFDRKREPLSFVISRIKRAC
jgi:hypothetical protein